MIEDEELSVEGFAERFEPEYRRDCQLYLISPAEVGGGFPDRLRAAREGRTTVLVTTSPLVLDRADRVLFLADGKVTASGTHRELLDGEPEYRRLVAREVEHGVAEPTGLRASDVVLGAPGEVAR